MRSRGAETFLLVLSTGNYYGKGLRRHRELSGSCAALGIAPRHCINIDKVDLRDGPRDHWPLYSVEASVRSMVARHNISLVVSFDERGPSAALSTSLTRTGISGHLNHRATSAAVSDLAVSDPHFPPTYLLQTVHYWVRRRTSRSSLTVSALRRVLAARDHPGGHAVRVAMAVQRTSRPGPTRLDRAQLHTRQSSVRRAQLAGRLGLVDLAVRSCLRLAALTRRRSRYMFANRLQRVQLGADRQTRTQPGLQAPMVRRATRTRIEAATAPPAP